MDLSSHGEYLLWNDNKCVPYYDYVTGISTDFGYDNAPGTTHEDDFSTGSSDDYVPETDEEAQTDAESKAEELDIVTSAREENPEIDQDMEGLIADVTNNEELELKTPTRKRKVKSGRNDFGYLRLVT